MNRLKILLREVYKDIKDIKNIKNIKNISHVPGLFYIDNAIPEDYSKKLNRNINNEDWIPVSKSTNSRKVQHYGYKYDYKRRMVAEKGDPIPSYFSKLIETLNEYIKKLNIKQVEFNQLIINKYEPGQGISKHTDANDYGPIIGCYTIGGGAIMKFTKDKSFNVYTKPNSLYIMTGESRYEWKHEMPSTKTDNVEGKCIKRDIRISITFRNVPTDDKNEKILKKA